MKSGLQKLAPKGESLGLPKIPPRSPCNDEPLGFAEDQGLPPGKGAGAPAQLEAARPPLRARTAVGDAGPAETEDSLCLPVPGVLPGEEPLGSRATQGGSAEQAPRPPLQTDDSIFLDEDSNQPMPVGRFFGNVELMQVRRASPRGLHTGSAHGLRVALPQDRPHSPRGRPTPATWEQPLPVLSRGSLPGHSLCCEASPCWAVGVGAGADSGPPPSVMGGEQPPPTLAGCPLPSDQPAGEEDKPSPGVLTRAVGWRWLR